MILVDTSIWIDHLHRPDSTLVSHLGDGLVATHPMVVGELALGSLRDRLAFLKLLAALPRAAAATADEVLTLVESRSLFGRGLSVVDASLLASVLMTPGATLWTRDRRLRDAARELGVDAELP